MNIVEKEKDFLSGVVEELLDEREEDVIIDPEDEDEEEIEEEELEEGEDELEEDEDEEIYLDDEEDELEFKRTKRTREEKERYAFEKLRKENKEKEERLKELDEIATAYGFTSHEAMLDKLREDAELKQARERNIDPEIYKTLKEQERELEKIKKEREEEKARSSVNTVITRVNDFKEKHSLDDSDIEDLLNDLDADGFTPEQLSRISNYEKLFTGYLRDTIIEKERQRRLKKEDKKKRLSESKLDGSGGNEEYSLDDLITATLNRNKTKY